MTTVDDDDFGLPQDILIQVQKKASGYKAKPGGKTSQQYLNTLKFAAGQRLAQVYVECPAISVEEAIKIVCASVGRNHQEFASKMSLFNRIRTLGIEGKLDLAEEKVKSTQSITDGVLARLDRSDERNEQNAREGREFMERMMGRMENLRIVGPASIAEHRITDESKLPNGSAI